MTKNQKIYERKFYLDQHGCAKNQVDGELIISHLEDEGWLLCDDPSSADLIVINSCGFIESAKKESLESLLSARESYPDAKIILAGCLAERYAEDFALDLKEADGIFGNGDLVQIKNIVEKLFPRDTQNEAESGAVVIRPSQEGVCTGSRTRFLNFPGSAYVKITEGCNNCCTFCAIPLIRGQLRSRPIEDIYNEISDLLNNGVFEINLIGQDLASYGRGVPDELLFSNSENEGSTNSALFHLLSKLSGLKGNFWIRLLYIHPDNFPLDILSIIKKDSRILPYFDIPFQSGDEKIIEAMNRHNSPSFYRSLVQTIRDESRKTSYADCAIRTTFLCGFPGETDEAAGNTEEFLSSIKPDWSGCFVYSKEEDTKAYLLKNQVPKKTASKRMESLVKLQQGITKNALIRHVGKVFQVLVEEVIEDSAGAEGLAIGRAWFQAPEVDGACVIRYELDDENAVSAVQSGKVISVKVIGSSDVDIDSVFISAAAGTYTT